ncbi:lysozyme family protein [Caryophanon latum]|nr:C40 family peptidase [Caryophanon latum]
MAIKKRRLEATNFKQQANMLKKHTTRRQTVEQRAIAHSKRLLNNTSTFISSNNQTKQKLHLLSTSEHETNNDLSYEGQQFDSDNALNFKFNVKLGTSKIKFQHAPFASNHTKSYFITSVPPVQAMNISNKLQKRIRHKLHEQHTQSNEVNPKHVPSFQIHFAQNKQYSTTSTSRDTKNPIYPSRRAFKLQKRATHNLQQQLIVFNPLMQQLASSFQTAKYSPPLLNKQNRISSDTSIPDDHFSNLQKQLIHKRLQHRSLSLLLINPLFQSLHVSDNIPMLQQKETRDIRDTKITSKTIKRLQYKIAIKKKLHSKLHKVSHIQLAKVAHTKQNIIAFPNTLKKKQRLTRVPLASYVATATGKQVSEMFKNKLERNDVGVQVASQTLTATAKSFQWQKKLRLKQNKHTLTKHQHSVQPKQIATNVSPIKNLIHSTQKLKLKRRISTLQHVQEELHFKKVTLKKTKSFLKTNQGEYKPTFIKRMAVSPVYTLLKKGSANYSQQLARDDSGVEVIHKSSALMKRSIISLDKVRKKLRDGKQLAIAPKNKLYMHTSKLKKNTSTPVRKINSQKLQKQAIKKKLVSKNRMNNVTLKNVVTQFVHFVKNINFTALKQAMLGKVAILAGSGFSVLLPVFIVLGMLILIIAMFSAGSSQQQQLNGTIGVAQNLSPDVEKWRSLVVTEATNQGMDSYVDLILAIIQIESGGRGTRDIMQSSESAGHPRNYFQSEAESVRQGISYVKNIITILQAFNNGFENEARLIAQSYNFGSPFANYVGKRGGTYDLSIAEDYSRTVVAPSLGNTTGETYSYINTVSKSFNKPYLYRNGGNYFYGELVGQYLGRAATIGGDFAIVLAEVEKYNGWSYVWGGKSPTVGFDCSGLVGWGLQQIGISLPSPAANQYNMTMPISEAEAKPGDLIFFRGTYGGPNHISHVGFYIDASTMYDANGSGVGYHNWKSAYWQQYKPEIRRIAQ